jgi:hypothetical protein
MGQRSTQGIRAALITALLILSIALLIGLFGDWATALAFIIGGSCIALCCFLSYYCRIAFSFNSIADTNMSSMAAFLTNNIPRREMPPRPGSELDTFKPFTFQQDKQKELEDMRVHALLRQVFPDEEV